MPTPANREDTATCEHISRMLARISDKWTMLVVRVLGKGPCRFNALRREVGEISQKVLASTLRDLEENGFVSRTVTPLTPPQVEYALTDLGREFLRPVSVLAEWVVKNSPRIDAAREAYAERLPGRSAWAQVKKAGVATAPRANPAMSRAKPAVLQK